MAPGTVASSTISGAVDGRAAGGRPGQAWARPLACLVLAVLCGGTERPVAAEAGAEPEPGMALGLVHVDLMDLHLERRPEGGGRARELLSADALAQRYEQARGAGGGWNRWSLYWDLVERPDGSFDWTVPDGIVQRDVAAGIASLPILQGTPPHRSAAMDLARCSASAASADALSRRPLLSPPARPWPARFGLPCRPASAPPRDLQQAPFLDAAGRPTEDRRVAVDINPANPWARFVDAAVARYAPGGVLARRLSWPADQGVRAWEVGNEPNLAHFWSGSVDQFARFQEVAWRVLKRRDPEATVLHGGIADDAGATEWYRSFLAALERRLREAGLEPATELPFDAAAWHWYVYPSLLQTGPARARQLLAERGLPERPLWVTELGVPIWNEHPGPCWDPASPWRATVTEQAGYLWQAYTEALASGVAALFFFQLYDDCGNGPASYDAFGMLRNHAENQCWTPPQGQPCWRRDPALDGTARPVWAAHRAWSQQLAGAGLLWRPPREDNLTQRVLFYRPPDLRVSVLWNHLRSEQGISFFSTGPSGTLWSIAADGRVSSQSIAPEAGRYTIALAGATNRNNPGNQSSVMAGLPKILVERDTAAPFRALVDTLPETSPSRLALKLRAADGGTGVGRWELLGADGDACRSPTAWRRLAEAAWTGDPLAGELAWEGDFPAGSAPCFALRAADRAGNWTRAPEAPQAQTRIVGGVATPGPSATEVPSPTSAPTATSKPTPTPWTPSVPVRPGAYLPLLSLAAPGTDQRASDSGSW